jgi:hypothetical protein
MTPTQISLPTQQKVMAAEKMLMLPNSQSATPEKKSAFLAEMMLNIREGHL